MLPPTQKKLSRKQHLRSQTAEKRRRIPLRTSHRPQMCNYIIYCDNNEDEIEKNQKRAILVEKTVEISGRSQLYDFIRVLEKA